MNKLLINCNSTAVPLRGNAQYVSGIGRSTQDLIENIYKEEPLSFDIETYFSGRQCFWNHKPLPYKTSYFRLPQRFDIKNRDFSIESLYVSKIKRPALVHIPHNFDPIIGKVRSLVTIHDTCVYDELKAGVGANSITELWETAAAKSVGIVTCSESSKKDIIDRFHVDDDKVTVIPWGISHELFHRVDKEVLDQTLNRLSIQRNYFLVVSCMPERKNMDNLLKAFALFARQNHEVDMILLWSFPPQYILEQYAKLIEEKRIVFKKFVSDQELVCLYNGALATMYPSRYEGFGFPILESFACGTPVMTCRNSSLGEIGGEYADFVHEDAIDEFVNQMDEYASEHFSKKEHLGDIDRYVERFSWKNTAKSYIKLYEKYL